MKFARPQCPECGRFADGTVDWIPGKALITFEGDEAFYDGETEVDWDGQTNDADVHRGYGKDVPDHTIRLVCPRGHEWDTLITESDE